ncbi:MAG: preprotein translocase subunit SecE [Chloroflexota bacterium]
MANKAEVQQENAISRYLRETRAELRKVVWPTREEAWRLTAIVLGVTAAFALFLWAVDSAFSTSIRFLIERLVGI